MQNGEAGKGHGGGAPHGIHADAWIQTGSHGDEEHVVGESPERFS